MSHFNMCVYTVCEITTVTNRYSRLFCQCAGLFCQYAGLFFQNVCLISRWMATMSRLFKKMPIFRKNYLYFRKSALLSAKELCILKYAFVYVHVKIDVCVCPESCAHILTTPPSLSVSVSFSLTHFPFACLLQK